MPRQTFGKTWWGAQWLHALREIDWENRLPRGRRYANNGSVEELAIDGDPFLVFHLRGVDLAAELEHRGLAITAEVKGAPPGLDELALAGADENEREPAPEPDSLTHIDYSGLSDLVDPLPQALPPNPSFSPAGDFRKRWTTQMRRLAKAARRQLEHGGTEAETHPTIRLTSDDKPLLLVDANADTTVIDAATVTELADLLASLGALDPADLPNYQPELAGLHATNRAALHLLQAGATVPWVFALPRGGIGLLWLPATFDPSVRTLIEHLARGLPSSLLRLRLENRQRRLSARMQARLLCGLFMDHWLREWGSELTEAQRGDKVMGLFFGAGSEWFDGPGEGAIAGSIRIWLARLHLTEGDHTPLLRLEEDTATFTLSIDVTARNDAPARAPTPLAQILQNPQWATQRGRILQTISMLGESYPPINDYVRAGASAPMRIAAEQLPELLFDVLPIIQLLDIRTLLPCGLEQLLRPKRSLEVTAKKRETSGFLSADDLFNHPLPFTRSCVPTSNAGSSGFTATPTRDLAASLPTTWGLERHCRSLPPRSNSRRTARSATTQAR